MSGLSGVDDTHNQYQSASYIYSAPHDKFLESVEQKRESRRERTKIEKKRAGRQCIVCLRLSESGWSVPIINSCELALLRLCRRFPSMFELVRQDRHHKLAL